MEVILKMQKKIQPLHGSLVPLLLPMLGPNAIQNSFYNTVIHKPDSPPVIPLLCSDYFKSQSRSAVM